MNLQFKSKYLGEREYLKIERKKKKILKNWDHSKTLSLSELNKRMDELTAYNFRSERELQKLLCERLGSLKICFRRNYPLVNMYWGDFVCREFRLVIEVDGGIHLSEKQKEKDSIKDDILRQFKWKVIRVKYPGFEGFSEVEKFFEKFKNRSADKKKKNKKQFSKKLISLKRESRLLRRKKMIERKKVKEKLKEAELLWSLGKGPSPYSRKVNL